MKSLSLARPHAIMLVGIPGSGKTVFASKFAETFNTPFINSTEIARYAVDEDAVSQLTGMMVEIAVTSKQTFVYEGNTDSRTHRTEFSRWARSRGYQPMLVWVQTDPRTAQDRSAKSSQMSPDDFESILRSFSPPHTSEQPVVISGRHTYASQLKVVLNHLAKARPATPIATPTRQQPAAPAPSNRTIQVQ